MRNTKTKVVIVGGGFAGLYAAMYLDKTLARRSHVDVVLMSRENFILFTPMLHEVAAGDLQPSDIGNPLRRILRHVKVVEAEVDAIDLRARKVSCVAGLRDVRREFEFDHLLLALGSETHFFDMAGVRDWAATMKTVSDAALLHNTMVALLETAALQADAPARRQLLTFVIAGGGFAGVETTGAVNDFIREYERANARVLEIRAGRAARAESAAHSTAVAPTSPEKTASSASDTIVSTWMIAPLIFLFLLADTGTIKRGLLRVVPNRLFEPALAVLADVDEALGNYVRGMFLECCLLGVTVIVFITIVGVPLRWAIAIGIFTGASNMVPYMGFAAALLSGLAYALLADNVHPILPFVTVDTFVIWVVVAVAFAELIKNVVYEPIVLGGAVKLHPIVVALGVVGAAILFGPAGMFLAIPTITVARVLAASSARHLTAYGVI